jgi:hypothetical protein
MSKPQLKNFFVALSIVAFFLGVLAFAVAHPRFFPANSSVEMLMNLSPTPVAVSTARGPIQNVRFTVYDEGIYPRQLRAQPGVVVIMLEDHTRRRPHLLIERETVGPRLAIGAMSFLLNQSRTRTEFRLDVGRYRVSDAANRANQAELIIEQ